MPLGFGEGWQLSNEADLTKVAGPANLSLSISHDLNTAAH